MYLSRVEINPRLRTCITALNSPQQLHAMIAASFPLSAHHAGERLYLWRIDKIDQSLFILVTSPKKPDFSHLIEQIGWPASEQSWETASYSPFLTRLDSGQKWQFRLRANPTWSKKHGEEPGVRGKVTPCSGIDEQKEWLERKMQKSGASLDSYDLTNRSVDQFARNKKTVTISTATYEGILTIVDAGLLRQAMVNGIGRAKGYGCGLLTLARASR
ncbi:MAG: type I-E CRISPR-associated protein Cas6/Cse3/CasE [Coriobacteriia bacterium]|nr:type I-E CRISPR-associated protein Cas6/Cse3/CasE [Coriobacteriia bacterium]